MVITKSPVPFPFKFCWLTCEYNAELPVNCEIKFGNIVYEPVPTDSLSCTFASPKISMCPSGRKAIVVMLLFDTVKASRFEATLMVRVPVILSPDLLTLVFELAKEELAVEYEALAVA